MIEKIEKRLQVTLKELVERFNAISPYDSMNNILKLDDEVKRMVSGIRPFRYTKDVAAKIKFDIMDKPTRSNYSDRERKNYYKSEKENVHTNFHNTSIPYTCIFVLVMMICEDSIYVKYLLAILCTSFTAYALHPVVRIKSSKRVDATNKNVYNLAASAVEMLRIKKYRHLISDTIMFLEIYNPIRTFQRKEKNCSK